MGAFPAHYFPRVLPYSVASLLFDHEPQRGLILVLIAVGTPIAERPPHGSERARLRHSALTLSV
jgi:hypothetical protein